MELVLPDAPPDGLELVLHHGTHALHGVLNDVAPAGQVLRIHYHDQGFLIVGGTRVISITEQDEYVLAALVSAV